MTLVFLCFWVIPMHARSAQDPDFQYATLVDEAKDLLKANQIQAAWQKIKNVPDDFFTRMHMTNVKQEVRRQVARAGGRPDDPKDLSKYRDKKLADMVAVARSSQSIGRSYEKIVLDWGRGIISGSEARSRFNSLASQERKITEEAWRLKENSDPNEDLSWFFLGCARVGYPRTILNVNRLDSDQLFLLSGQIKRTNKDCVSFFSSAIKSKVTRR
jgi:hypothetical protein